MLRVPCPGPALCLSSPRLRAREAEAAPAAVAVWLRGQDCMSSLCRGPLLTGLLPYSALPLPLRPLRGHGFQLLPVSVPRCLTLDSVYCK